MTREREDDGISPGHRWESAGAGEGARRGGRRTLITGEELGCWKGRVRARTVRSCFCFLAFAFVWLLGKGWRVAVVR